MKQLLLIIIAMVCLTIHGQAQGFEIVESNPPGTYEVCATGGSGNLTLEVGIKNNGANILIGSFSTNFQDPTNSGGTPPTAVSSPTNPPVNPGETGVASIEIDAVTPLATGGPWALSLNILDLGTFETTSLTYTIVLDYLPEITLAADPENSAGKGVICEPGGTVLLTTTSVYSSASALSYAWTKDSDDLSDITASISAMDVGVYSVEASNACGTSEPIDLEVIAAAAPGFTSQPVDFTACEGEDAEFEGQATPGTTSLQWQKKASGDALFSDVAGETMEILQVAAVNASEDGTLYRLKANNEGCEAVSNEATLSVSDPSALVVGPGVVNNEELGSNEEKIFVQNIIGHQGANTTIEWNIDGTPITITADRFPPDDEQGVLIDIMGSGKNAFYSVYNQELAPGTIATYLELTNLPGGMDVTTNAFLTVTTTDDNGETCGTFMSNIAEFIFLPIELISFTGQATTEGVNLEWVTASELDNDFYTLERSFDGYSFDKIAKLPGAGNSDVELSYQYTDVNVLNAAKDGIAYYRLKQTDFDGQFSYSEIIAVTFDVGPSVLAIIQMLPVEGQLNFKYSSPIQGAVTATVMDMTGRLVYRHDAVSLVGLNEDRFDLSQLPSGIYVLNLKDGQQSVSKRFLR